MKSKKLVLSRSEFFTVKEAEDKVNGWWTGGSLKLGTKLYEVTEVYDLRLKYIKRKK